MLRETIAKSICILCCICLMQTKIFAQTDIAAPDTLKLDVKQAEKLFLEKNLSLLAQYYNIQSSKALVEQARKWENPTLNTDQNVWRKGEGFFKHSTVTDANGNQIIQGQYYVQVQQLIKTAGKRGKQIAIAKTNVNLAEWQFKATMRELRVQLLTDMYTIAQDESKAQLYDEEMQQLQKLMQGMEKELTLGNIAKKEYLRVQALIISLQKDIVDNAKELSDNQSELKTLLLVTGNTYIKPLLPETESAEIPQLSVLTLLDSARLHNTDYQQEVYQLKYQQQNLSLQKSLAIPDLTFGPEFDQNSNYAPNYYGIGISLPLPVWDRNQGNIKSSKFQVKSEEAAMQLTDKKLQNDVLNAYQKLLMTAKFSSGSNNKFYTEYNELHNNIIKSYNDRQISLIEFLTYFDDYSDIREKQLEQILNLRLAKQVLNDIVGIDIVE